MQRSGQRPGVRRWGVVALLGMLLTSACAGTTVSGDAGCTSYGEARLAMPGLGVDALSQWVADMDDRMTGACKG